MKFKDERGFNVVNLMIILGILGILAAIGIPNYVKHKNSALATKAEKCKKDQVVVPVPIPEVQTVTPIFKNNAVVKCKEDLSYITINEVEYQLKLVGDTVKDIPCFD